MNVRNIALSAIRRTGATDYAERPNPVTGLLFWLWQIPLWQIPMPSEAVQEAVRPVIDAGLVGLLGWIVGILCLVVTVLFGLGWRMTMKQLEIRDAEIKRINADKDQILRDVIGLMTRTSSTVQELVRKSDGSLREEAEHQAHVVSALREIRDTLVALRKL